MAQTVDMRGVLLANSTSPKRASNYPLGNRPVGSWLLASEYKVGQKLPLKVTYPRPDTETTSYAIHRKASTNWPYKMRVAIQGGEAPFKYEIISGGAGATIVGEFSRTLDPTGMVLHSIPTDYATLTWPSPSGTANWVIRVTDQSGATVDVTWSTQADDAAFIVVAQTGGNDSNPGTYASPKQTFANGIWKNSDSDSSFATKIIAFKTGTYAVHSAGATSDCSINASDKPRAYIGIESGAILDTSNGHFWVNTGNAAFVNLEIRGSRTDLANNRIINVSAKYDNYLFWKLTFSQQTTGTVSTDNPACIMFWDEPNTPSYNIAVVDCILASTAAMQLIVTFACDDVLVENNTLTDLHIDTNHNGSVLLHIKDDTRNVTVRFNRTTGSCLNGMIRLSNQISSGSTILNANQEVCYNYVNSTTESASVIFNQNATGGNNATNVHCYRNTIVTPNEAIAAQRWIGGDTVKVSGNAYTGPAVAQSDSSTPGYEIVSPSNVQIAASDLDSQGRLNNATGKRTSYLGKIGFEFASTGAV